MNWKKIRMRFETASASYALIINGKGAPVLNPWRITIDLRDNYHSKAEWNYDWCSKKQAIAHKHVWNIKFDQHFVGADIHINVVGGYDSAYCLKKSDAEKIKQILFDHNQLKKGNKIILFKHFFSLHFLRDWTAS